jgi:tetratricopeptide (TPR) repeat protein
MTQDALGHAVSGATSESLSHYETALHEFQCYIGDPVRTVEQALDAGPETVMAHILKAYLYLLGTEPEGIPVAHASHEAAAALPANERERGHIRGVGELVDGRWHAAGMTLEDVAIAHPRDVLALQAGHLVGFYTGSSRMLRDRIARALPAWSADMPGHHAIRSMYAFGLEENGDYAQAERYGRLAVEEEPRDGWGWHAVAHVMEMQGRGQDGIAWLGDHAKAWSEESFFAVHLWWHLALYYLEFGDIDRALVLFDGPIHGQRSPVVLDMIDAASVLWRLHLRGIDVGTRWQTVADVWEPLADVGTYAFNDAHAAMAFVGAGRTAAVARLLAAQAAAMERADDNVAFTRDVGHPVTMAIIAFGGGDYDEAVRLLRPVRAIANRFGGSHAQRDLIDLTLIEAACRAGQGALARALAAERIAAKPTSPLARLYSQRAEAVALAA